MLPTSLLLEVLVALLTGIVVLLLWRAGRRERLAQDQGWRPVFLGFCLLFFGALVDISDHFPELSYLQVLGQTPLQSLIEKIVGFFGGFLCVAIGLFRWLPYVAERRREEEALRSKNEDLEQKLRQGSKELHLNKLQNEAALRRHRRLAHRTENLVEAVASGAPVALIATDSAGKISVATGRALPALGISADVLGDLLVDLVPLIAEPLSQALDGLTVTTNFRSGELTFQARCTPWLAEGRQVGAVVIATDITDLVRAQDELRLAKENAEAASRAKSDFVASMSHELRTPLNSVIGFANLLQKNKDNRLTAQDLKFLSRISDNGKHLLGLINEILDLSKIEAGRMDIVREPVDLRALIQEVAAQMAPQAHSDVQLGIKLEVGLDDEPTTDQISLEEIGTMGSEGDGQEVVASSLDIVETDHARLRQVLVNLTANALKFTHQGKVTIHLHYGETGKPEAISVTDTGIGIPEDHLAGIFDAFQQVEMGTTRQYSGTGLGLAITRSLCEWLGPRVDRGERGRTGLDVHDLAEWAADRLSLAADTADTTREHPDQGAPSHSSQRLEIRLTLEQDACPLFSIQFRPKVTKILHSLDVGPVWGDSFCRSARSTITQ